MKVDADVQTLLTLNEGFVMRTVVFARFTARIVNGLLVAAVLVVAAPFGEVPAMGVAQPASASQGSLGAGLQGSGGALAGNLTRSVSGSGGSMVA